MTQIILSAEQAQAVIAASDAVELRDDQGLLLGYVARPASKGEVAEAKRRLESDGPWHTTEHVLKHLNSLEQ
jgi:hypothetical protein